MKELVRPNFGENEISKLVIPLSISSTLKFDYLSPKKKNDDVVVEDLPRLGNVSLRAKRIIDKIDFITPEPQQAQTPLKNTIIKKEEITEPEVDIFAELGLDYMVDNDIVPEVPLCTNENNLLPTVEQDVDDIFAELGIDMDVPTDSIPEIPLNRSKSPIHPFTSETSHNKNGIYTRISSKRQIEDVSASFQQFQLVETKLTQAAAVVADASAAYCYCPPTKMPDGSIVHIGKKALSSTELDQLFNKDKIKESPDKDSVINEKQQAKTQLIVEEPVSTDKPNTEKARPNVYSGCKQNTYHVDGVFDTNGKFKELTEDEVIAIFIENEKPTDTKLQEETFKEIDPQILQEQSDEESIKTLNNLGTDQSTISKFRALGIQVAGGHPEAGCCAPGGGGSARRGITGGGTLSEHKGHAHCGSCGKDIQEGERTCMECSSSDKELQEVEA